MVVRRQKTELSAWEKDLMQATEQFVDRVRPDLIPAVRENLVRVVFERMRRTLRYLRPKNAADPKVGG